MNCHTQARTSTVMSLVLRAQRMIPWPPPPPRGPIHHRCVVKGAKGGSWGVQQDPQRWRQPLSSGKLDQHQPPCVFPERTVTATTSVVPCTGLPQILIQSKTSDTELQQIILGTEKMPECCQFSIQSCCFCPVDVCVLAVDGVWGGHRKATRLLWARCHAVQQHPRSGVRVRDHRGP